MEFLLADEPGAPCLRAFCANVGLHRFMECTPKLRGAVDNAVNLARCKSSLRQLPVVGRIAYPMRAKATMHVRLGCKSLSCPAGEPVAVGTTREASKLGGLNIKE